MSAAKMKIEQEKLMAPTMKRNPGSVKRYLHHSPDKPEQVVDRLRTRVLERAEEDPACQEILRVGDFGQNIKLVENMLYRFVRVLDGQHSMRDGILYANRVKLEGVMYPQVSRYDALDCNEDSIPAAYLEAAQYGTDVVYVLHEEYAELVIEGLMESDTFLHDDHLQDWFDRLEEEVNRHGFGTDTYIPLRIFDWRGRVYADTKGILSYQADKLSRALLWFKELRPDPDGHIVEYLRAVYGVTEDNYEELMANPAATIDRFGDMGATLSAACAMDEFIRTGCSSFCCRMDQTTSGGAYIAAMDRSLNLATNCNLMGGPRRDVYMNHTNRVRLRDVILKQRGRTPEGLALIRKHVSKPTCCPGFYGVGKNTLTYNFLTAGNPSWETLEPEDLVELESKIDITPVLQPHFEGLKTYEAHFKKMKRLVGKFISAFRSEVPEQGHVDRRHRFMMQAALAQREVLDYTTPLGWHVVPSHVKRDIENTHRVKNSCAILGDDSCTVSNVVYKDVPEAVTYFPHGLDGCTNCGGMLEFKRLGVPAGCTHDEWLVHSCHLPIVPGVIRNALVHTLKGFAPQYEEMIEAYGEYTTNENGKLVQHRIPSTPVAPHIHPHIPEDAQFVVV